MPLAGQALLAWGKTEPRCAFLENALCVPFMCPMFPSVFLLGEVEYLCVLKINIGESYENALEAVFMRQSDTSIE